MNLDKLGLRLLQNAAAILLFVHVPAGKFLHANDIFCMLLLVLPCSVTLAPASRVFLLYMISTLLCTCSFIFGMTVHDLKFILYVLQQAYTLRKLMNYNE